MSVASMDISSRQPESPAHLRIGDSAATMRLLCGEPITDSCWTQNPNHVTCVRCVQLLAGPQYPPTPEAEAARAEKQKFLASASQEH